MFDLDAQPQSIAAHLDARRRARAAACARTPACACRARSTASRSRCARCSASRSACAPRRRSPDAWRSAFGEPIETPYPRAVAPARRLPQRVADAPSARARRARLMPARARTLARAGAGRAGRSARARRAAPIRATLRALASFPASGRGPRSTSRCARSPGPTRFPPATRPAQGARRHVSAAQRSRAPSLAAVARIRRDASLGSANSQGSDMTDANIRLLRASMPSPLGTLIARRTATALTGVVHGRRAPRARAATDVACATTRAARWRSQQLREYFAGERTRFDLPLACAARRFSSACGARCRDPVRRRRSATASWRGASAQPRGGARGRRRERTQSARRIVVPCHRVVGSDGSLTGYAGGLDAQALAARSRGRVRAVSHRSRR